MNNIRNTKRTVYFLSKTIVFILLPLMLFTTCIKVKDYEEPVTLSVSTTSLSFPSYGGEQTFSVSSNDYWFIDHDHVSWLSVSPTDDWGNSSVKIISYANTSTSQRAATITVRSWIDGVREQVINVTQAGYGAAGVGTVIYSGYTGGVNDYFYCDGRYDSDHGAGFQTNLKNLNRNNFKISFSFMITEYKNGEQWALMLSDSHRILGVCLKADKKISITTNNQRYEYNTNISYQLNTWINISVEHSNGLIRINNGSWFNVVFNTIEGDNVLSSTNFSSGDAFKGFLRNIEVVNYN